MSRPRFYCALGVCLPLLLTGCHHVVWGNVMALMMAAGLFFGTLSLGRIVHPNGAVDTPGSPPELRR